jgi:para-aminobenzoate synthetase component 1
VRLTLPLGGEIPFVPELLRKHERFLFRRMLDQDRAVLGIDALETLEAPIFSEQCAATDWYFGLLEFAYDEGPDARHPERGPDAHPPRSQWFRPRWVVEWKEKEAFLHHRPEDADKASEFAEQLRRPVDAAPVNVPNEWICATSRTRYLEQAGRLMAHIQRGDIYEINHCVERSADLPDLDPFQAFARLQQRTEAPYAGFDRQGQRFALCASPERFLGFQNDRVWGQPMKGTRPRSYDATEDARLAAELANDPKERSEHVMALDVMRHDLSRTAASRSVVVEELFAVRSFPKVHQMVSTVAARIRADRTPFDVVRAAFPMASMTGAPKGRALELIHATEDRERGLYSGSLGFFAPDGSGDLNVVIRSILFDRASGRATLSTGSALTSACMPGLEWEECTLKARSIIDALGHA